MFRSRAATSSTSLKRRSIASSSAFATTRRLSRSSPATTLHRASERPCANWQDLPSEWIPPNAEVIVDDGISPRELDRIEAAVTGCSLGIAETGTVVLDAGAAQGRRLLTLVPDVHICVIREEQVVDGVPAAMRRLGAELRTSHPPLTFVSGPSATSDIELSRVEGVHGPRRFALVMAR